MPPQDLTTPEPLCPCPPRSRHGTHVVDDPRLRGNGGGGDGGNDDSPPSPGAPGQWLFAGRYCHRGSSRRCWYRVETPTAA